MNSQRSETRKRLWEEARKLVAEWDDFGQGYDVDGKLVRCICGAVRADGDWSEHYCPYDAEPEEGTHS